MLSAPDLNSATHLLVELGSEIPLRHRGYRLVAKGCLAILELRVLGAGANRRADFRRFPQNRRVANATEVRLLGGLIHGRDLHEVLKIAQPSSRAFT